VFVWKKDQVRALTRTGCDPLSERSRLDTAIQRACQQIGALAENLAVSSLDDEAAVFNAHIMLVEDKALRKKVDQQLDTCVNAEAAWSEAVESFARQLEGLSDPTLSLRGADLRDVGERVLRILLGAEAGMQIQLDQAVVVVARDLSPSETVSLDRSKVLGFCTAEGGPTSHTAILAKALALPAVVGLGESILGLENGTLVLVDGHAGQVIADPDESAQESFRRQAARAGLNVQADIASAGEPAVTLDAVRLEIVANVGNVADACTALEHGAEGIGLLRTEFLFLERSSSPSEEDQFQSYSRILDVMGGRPVVARTLDAGGDKEIPFLAQTREANPFLGWRAIRLCLGEPEFFKTQLRALLRASPGHDLRIMFPMIATLEEVRAARRLLEDAREEVLLRGQPVADHIQIGIMVEIPSVVVLADLFAREVDFFSVGTNDLTQYSLAADRTNQKVSHLSDHCHPAILRQLHSATRAAHAAGIWIGICGEMGGDPDAVPILVGLGLDELSMSPSRIPAAKRIIRSWDSKLARGVAEACLQMDSAQAVRQFVRSHGAARSQCQ
jgi:phosphoenolpyruvate-protein phosphotransferase